MQMYEVYAKITEIEAIIRNDQTIPARELIADSLNNTKVLIRAVDIAQQGSLASK
jgi:hypothetical protein